MRLTIHIPAAASLHRVTQSLAPANRLKLNRAIAEAEQSLLRDHFIDLALTRHQTAVTLGGLPTNRWAQTVSAVIAPSALHATTEAASVTINDPGISRAFHDVTITPTAGHKFLTIPVAAISYGHPISSFFDPKNGVFIRQGTDALYYCRTFSPSWSELLYRLVPVVHQKQDSTLLPTPGQFLSTAINAADTYLHLHP